MFYFKLKLMEIQNAYISLCQPKDCESGTVLNQMSSARYDSGIGDRQCVSHVLSVGIRSDAAVGMLIRNKSAFQIVPRKERGSANLHWQRHPSSSAFHFLASFQICGSSYCKPFCLPRFSVSLDTMETV